MKFVIIFELILCVLSRFTFQGAKARNRPFLPWPHSSIHTIRPQLVNPTKVSLQNFDELRFFFLHISFRIFQDVNKTIAWIVSSIDWSVPLTQ